MKEIVVSNGLYPIITQALEEMKSEQGDSFRLGSKNEPFGIGAPYRNIQS